MMMSAAVKTADGYTTVIESEYESKQAFKKDLNSNGYTVIGRISVANDTSKRTELYNKGCK